MRVDIACGGTGGHTFPGVVTGRALRDRGHQVKLWLAGRGVERNVAQGWEGAVQVLHGVGAYGNAAKFARPVRLMLAIVTALRDLLADRPAVLLAMGSYACVPPVVAARLCGVPVILHEANVVPGAAVRWLSRLAREIAIGFAETAEHLRGRCCHVTGFPVRPQFRALPSRAQAEFTVLVVGGSQGAHVLNEVVPEALAILKGRGCRFRVIHVAGQADAAKVVAYYETVGIMHATHAFMTDIWTAYAAADLAVTRAGAATCAELAVAGLPALLIPYPHAAADHQAANARAMAAQGGVDVRMQEHVSSAWLADYLEGAIRDPSRLSARRAALAGHAIPDGALRLAVRVEHVGGFRNADI